MCRFVNDANIVKENTPGKMLVNHFMKLTFLLFNTSTQHNYICTSSGNAAWISITTGKMGPRIPTYFLERNEVHLAASRQCPLLSKLYLQITSVSSSDRE